MEIRSGLEGLRSLLGVETSSRAPARATPQPSPEAAGGDRATLSSAANEMAQTGRGTEVRNEKVAAIQAALAAGTYAIPAAAVAAKVVDSMLAGASPTEMAQH